MFMSKTREQIARSAGPRPPRKLVAAAAFVAWALGAFATQAARATPPSGFTATLASNDVESGCHMNAEREGVTPQHLAPS